MNLLLESAVLLVLLVVSVFGLLLFIVRKNSGVGKQSSGGGRLKVSTGLAAIKGWRETMEDDHALFDDLHNHEEYGKIFSKFGSGLALYCGIYDGHRGSTTSHFLAKRLHKNIFTHPKFNPNGDVMRAIADSHVKTDNEFVAENKGKNDGSTSVVALILETKLYIANLGDSEAILCKSGDALDFEVLTKIHKPTDPDERKRIEDANGVVFNGRLSGVIAVSRSFGDVDLKVPFDEGDWKIGVLMSNEAYCREVMLQQSHQFLLLGCDGVWEAMKHEESVAFVKAKIAAANGRPDVNEICNQLVTEAKRKGSRDNISAALIIFHW